MSSVLNITQRTSSSLETPPESEMIDVWALICIEIAESPKNCFRVPSESSQCHQANRHPSYEIQDIENICGRIQVGMT